MGCGLLFIQLLLNKSSLWVTVERLGSSDGRCNRQEAKACLIITLILDYDNESESAIHICFISRHADTSDRPAWI